MFGIDFPELVVIGVVALIVLGPERLPKAARFAGLWARRARAQWASVRSELERELAAEEFRRALHESEAALRDFNAGLRTAEDNAQREFDAVRKAATSHTPADATLPATATAAGASAAETVHARADAPAAPSGDQREPFDTLADFDPYAPLPAAAATAAAAVRGSASAAAPLPATAAVPAAAASVAAVRTATDRDAALAAARARLHADAELSVSALMTDHAAGVCAHDAVMRGGSGRRFQPLHAALAHDASDDDARPEGTRRDGTRDDSARDDLVPDEAMRARAAAETPARRAAPDA